MKPTRAYIICSTPRSGSTLLCNLLAQTNVAGSPASYFRRQSIPNWAARLNVDSRDLADADGFFRAYLSAVKSAGRGDTGILGIRLMWESLRELNDRLDILYPGLPGDAARLEAAFGEIVYVHLSRLDKVAQAVSLVKAGQTGLWHVAPDGSELERTKPRQSTQYDADLLDDHVRQLDADDEAWRHWFESQRIVPVTLTYEALANDPRGELSRVLAAIGEDPAVADTVRPGTARMADDESLEWMERYRSERAFRRDDAPPIPYGRPRSASGR